MGLIPVSGGRLYITGSEFTNIKSHELVKMGIGYVPQVSNVFPTLTIEENLEIGLWTQSKNIKQNNIKLIVNSFFIIVFLLIRNFYFKSKVPSFYILGLVL